MPCGIHHLILDYDWVRRFRQFLLLLDVESKADVLTVEELQYGSINARAHSSLVSAMPYFAKQLHRSTLANFCGCEISYYFHQAFPHRSIATISYASMAMVVDQLPGSNWYSFYTEPCDFVCARDRIQYPAL